MYFKALQLRQRTGSHPLIASTLYDISRLRVGMPPCYRAACPVSKSGMSALPSYKALMFPWITRRDVSRGSKGLVTPLYNGPSPVSRRYSCA